MDDSPLYSFILFIIFVVLNAVMYAFGEALRMLNETELERQAEEGDRKAVKLQKIIEKPDKLIVTIHIITGVTTVLVGYFQLRSYGSRCRDFFADKIGSMFTDGFIFVLSYLLIAIYLLFLVVALGILVPKKLGAAHSEGCARGLFGIVTFIMKILTPFSAITGFFAGIVLRVFGIDPNEDVSKVTEEEIISIVNEGHEMGVLEEREAEMISNIIELDDKTAGDVMVHRKHITAVDGTWTLEQAVDFIIRQNYSRFPVYVDDIDNIIGILHLRNAMAHYCGETDNTRQIKDIPDILMEARFIPESRNVDDLFREMQTSKTHMEVVVDEYGQTSGIVAMEDILEEIVGNILDEYDIDENNIVAEEDGTWLMKGLTTLEEIEDVFGDKLESEDYDTLNGFLISKLDRIPSEDEKPELIIDNYSYKILAVSNKTISLVRVKKLENEEAEQDAESDAKE